MAQLTVASLWYQPSLDVVQVAEEKARYFMDNYIPSAISNVLPHFISERSMHCAIHNVSFRCRPGEITAILTKSKAERKTILELIANRRFGGSFDGDISIEGAKPGTSFDSNIAYVHRKILFVPGLTYQELLMYAAKLRLKSSDASFIRDRVKDVLSVMDLMHCRNRKIEESPSLRGVSGGELRRLSIACEIVALPSVLLFEDPTLTLEPGVGHSIMACIHSLATRGHTVICAMDNVSAHLLPMVSQVVVIADGYSIFASNADNIEAYFCSDTMGYKKRSDVHVMDFVMDIANGIERSVQSRLPEAPKVLHYKFATSTFNTINQRSIRTKSESPPIRGLPVSNYFDAKYDNFKSVFNCGSAAGNAKAGWDRLQLWLYRVYLVVERQIFIKASDVQLLARGVLASMIVSSVVGYLQYNCANYGYYSMTFVGFPYVGTANTTAVIFFISAFTIAQQALNVQLVCQSLQMFRYEQFSGVCPALGYFLGFLVTEVPIVCINAAIFATIVFFMTQMSYGLDNYLFFAETLALNALTGLFTATLLALTIKKEIPVRDVYFLLVFGMVMLSGFPFQLPYIRWYMNDISQINPMRWTFEAIMNWKFSKYEDGQYYLIPFDFSTFHQYEIFQILLTFLLQGGFTIFALLLPWPYLLYRRSKSAADRSLSREGEEDPERALSLDSDFGVESQDVVRNSLLVPNLEQYTGRESNVTKRLSDVPKRASETGRNTESDRGSLQRPHLFNRETSITGRSQLSINISQTSIHNSLTAFNNYHDSSPSTAINNNDPSGASKETLLKNTRGPTVEFRKLNYSVQDPFAPMGVKKVLQNVSGQFDWGKLSMILGASHSGRSSLLHILAGDYGLSSQVQGEILFDNAPSNRNIPLWERCALVEAHDEQYRDITVRDAVTYAMMLRCPMRSLMGIAKSNVQRTIELLHLDEIVTKKCKQISHGQRRRLSIAEEIVGGPNLLLIDEPTTELDDVHDASIMMQCFRELVNQDKTVICAMHKPSENVFNLFDTVCLLAKGQVIYFGPVSDAVKYFTSLPNPYSFSGGFKNPGDFLTDISGGYIATVTGDLLLPSVLAEYHEESVDRKSRGFKTNSTTLTLPSSAGNTPNKVVDTLVPTFTPLNELSGVVTHEDNTSTTDVDETEPVSAANIGTRLSSVFCPAMLGAMLSSAFHFITSLCSTNIGKTFITAEVILVRSFQALYNRKKLILACLILHVLMACFLGWVLGPSSDQAYNLTSFFAIGTLMLYFANLQLVYFLFTTHQVFLKEHSRGLYSTFMYWLLSQLPLYILKSISAVLFSVITYALLALGLDGETEGFFILTTICSVVGGHMVAEWTIFMIKDIRTAYISLPVWYFLFFAFSGLFIKASSLPDWMAPWAPSFSLIRWAMQAQFINYFDGSSVFPVLPFGNTYQQFLILFGWGGKTKWYCLSMIVAQIGCFKLLSLFSAAYSAINQRGGRYFKMRK